MHCTKYFVSCEHLYKCFDFFQNFHLNYESELNKSKKNGAEQADN